MSALATDHSQLEAWLDANGLGAGPVSLAPIGDGHSNPTFLLTRGADRWVLRRAPHGPLAPSAHDVLREAAWMRALGPLGVPVPAVLGGTDDKEPVGSAFFVMELVGGFVPGDDLPAEIDHPDGRRALANTFVDALADLHEVPIDGPALDRFRRPGRYLERQTKRFTEMWERNKTRPMPALDAVGEWVVRNVPATEAQGVVHGDARPGNAIFRGDELVALLDWELAALGDPLADVGYLLATWAEPGDPDDDPLLEVSRWTRAPGFPTRAELAARYAERRGTPADDLRFYEVLALWKAVIVMEGNYRRYVEGRADNPYFERYADGLPRLAERALALTENH